MYGPQGSPHLIPDAQPPQAPLKFGRMDASSAPSQQFVEIVNNLTYAVDVSGWSIAGAAKASIKPGALGVSSVCMQSVHPWHIHTELH